MDKNRSSIVRIEGLNNRLFTVASNWNESIVDCSCFVVAGVAGAVLCGHCKKCTSTEPVSQLCQSCSAMTKSRGRPPLPHLWFILDLCMPSPSTSRSVHFWRPSKKFGGRSQEKNVLVFWRCCRFAPYFVALLLSLRRESVAVLFRLPRESRVATVREFQEISGNLKAGKKIKASGKNRKVVYLLRRLGLAFRTTNIP